MIPEQYPLAYQKPHENAVFYVLIDRFSVNNSRQKSE
jgi:hypothetical protein